MMIAIGVGVGILAGIAAGSYAGYDLGHASSRLSRGNLGALVFLGLLRRMAVISAALCVGLALGTWALAGACAGTLAGFAVVVALLCNAGSPSPGSDGAVAAGVRKLGV